MIDEITLTDIQEWLNSNTGVLSLILFIGAIFIGWISGFFKSIIKKPKFKIRIIPKMTFGAVFYTGRQYTPPMQGTYDIHKTAFVLYLEITNTGTADSNLGKIKIGYYRNNGKRSFFQKRLWIYEHNILDVFYIPSGDGQSLIIPHMRQATPELNKSYDGFIEVGNSLIGAAYFEQSASWGNQSPRVGDDNHAKIKIVVKDVFNNRFTKKVKIPMIPIQEAFNYNHKFGMTEHYLERDLFDLDSKEDQENKGGVIDNMESNE